MSEENNKKESQKKKLPLFFGLGIVLLAIVFSASLIFSEPKEVESAWSFSCFESYETCDSFCSDPGYCVFVPEGTLGGTCDNQWTCVNDDIGGPCDQNAGLCEPACTLTTDKTEYGPEREWIEISWKSWGGYRAPPPPITGNLVSCPNENPECWVPFSPLNPPHEGSARVLTDENWTPQGAIIKMRAKFQQSPGPIRECTTTFFGSYDNGGGPPPPPPANKFCPAQGWAWSGYNPEGLLAKEGIGWESFSDKNQNDLVKYGVWTNVEDGWLSGFTWHPTIGWIRFAGLSGFPSGSGTVSSNARVLANGDVVGWARACSVFENDCSGDIREDRFRGGWDGWISLSGTGYKITYDKITRKFSGWAWGGDKVAGWISWSSQSPDHPRPTRNYGVSLGDENQCVNELFDYTLFADTWYVLENPQGSLPHAVTRQFVGTIAKPVKITTLTITDVPLYGEITLTSEEGQNRSAPIPIPVSIPDSPLNNPHLIIEIPLNDYICPEGEQGIEGYFECDTFLQRYIVEGDSDVKKTEYLVKEEFFKTLVDKITSLPKIFAQTQGPEPMKATVCGDLVIPDPEYEEVCSDLFEIDWGDPQAEFDYDLSISNVTLPRDNGVVNNTLRIQRTQGEPEEVRIIEVREEVGHSQVDVSIGDPERCTPDPDNCDTSLTIDYTLAGTTGPQENLLYTITTESREGLQKIDQFGITILPGGETALISCSANPPFAIVGQSVTWEAEVDQNLEYDFLQWSGHPEIEGQRGEEYEVSSGYSLQGRKEATVTACNESDSEGECIPIETSSECSTNIFFNLFFEQF